MAFRLSAPYGAAGCGLAEPYRVAVYYAPEADDPLWRAGCAWLGCEPETDESLEQPVHTRLSENTAEPRRYGFHATLKAPMALRFGLGAFLQSATVFAARQRSFLLPRLEVTSLHGFLALCPAEASPELTRLAAACVTELDPHRLPEDAAAQTKRAAGRSAKQAAYIARWGYPLVLDEFHFHMTLTGKMEDNPYTAAATAHFKPALAQARLVKQLAIFTQNEKDAPFRLFRRLSFTG